MKVLVLGGGVVGVTTAYYLAQADCEVALIDRQPEAASETSYGNAGLYTPGDSYAWASPDALRMAVKSLYRRDLGIKYKIRLDPRLWAWSLKFLTQCTHAQAYRNTLLKLRIALYSKQCLNALIEQTGIDYDGKRKGVIYFFRSEQSLEHGTEHMKILQEHGLPLEILDQQSLYKIDPGLAAAGDKIAGGVYSPQDQTGDSCKFSRNLATWCAQHKGVQLVWNTQIQSIQATGQRVTKAITDQGEFSADAIVLAAGAESPLLSEKIGVKLPIYPVKGYSITAPIRNPDAAPNLGIVDEDKLIAMSRLGDRLRVASTAEFTGYDRSHQPKHFKSIFSVARELFPAGADYDQAECWAGLRPMTPSSVPILGRARYDNFYVNVGHGHVGWTMSCGTGKFVTDLIMGCTPEIDPQGLLY